MLEKLFADGRSVVLIRAVRKTYKGKKRTFAILQYHTKLTVGCEAPSLLGSAPSPYGVGNLARVADALGRQQKMGRSVD